MLTWKQTAIAIALQMPLVLIAAFAGGVAKGLHVSDEWIQASQWSFFFWAGVTFVEYLNDVRAKP